MSVRTGVGFLTASSLVFLEKETLQRLERISLFNVCGADSEDQLEFEGSSRRSRTKTYVAHGSRASRLVPSSEPVDLHMRDSAVVRKFIDLERQSRVFC